MTQLVTAICEKGQKIITVSDRMVSTGDMTLAFEHSSMKAIPIAETAVILTAGTVHMPDLIRQAKEKVKGKDRILDMANALKEVYQEFRERHIVDEILRPKAGIKSFEEWHEKQTKLHDSVVFDLQKYISGYDLGLSIILAGVDTEGHLIFIGNPGTYRSYDKLLYCTVGMGDRHAQNVFAWYKYSHEFSLNETLYIAFEAKKKSEMAGGVGPSTDIIIIDGKGIEKLKGETVNKLEEIYNGRESSAERGKFGQDITKLKIQKEKVGNSSSRT